MLCKAQDESGLTPVGDDNAARRKRPAKISTLWWDMRIIM